MKTHYKDKKHPRYPNTGCGKTGISIQHTSNIEDVDCPLCIKSYNNHKTPVKGLKK